MKYWEICEWERLDSDGSTLSCGMEVVEKSDGADRKISACTVEDEDLSDLHLISSAPQLLAALEDAEKIIRGIAEQVPLVKARCDAYARIIAKAKGGAA